jgi:uncharacterized delta-60 repeat protein
MIYENSNLKHDNSASSSEVIWVRRGESGTTSSSGALNSQARPRFINLTLRHTAPVVLALLATFIGVPGLLAAGPGMLDPTFGGGDGMVSEDFTSTFETLMDVALQPDGKIIAAGYRTDGSPDFNFMLVRYNADGSPDTSFGGGDGWVSTDFSGGDDIAGAVALQPDGKIVVGGVSGTEKGRDFALARYNADGSPDLSFGDAGKVTTDLGSEWDVGRAMLIQPDGKIVLAGNNGGDGMEDVALVRYISNGKRDTDFGDDGVITKDLGSFDYATAIALQSDGRIVVGARSDGGFYLSQLLVLRYNADGTPDTNFDGDGFVNIDHPGIDENVVDLKLQSDGKIVLAGTAIRPGTGSIDALAARLKPNGNPDTSFGGGDGFMTTARAGEDRAYTVAIQSDGRIFLGGYTVKHGAVDFIIVHLNKGGKLDKKFGKGGFVTTDFGASTDFLDVLLLQPDGKLIAAGTRVEGPGYNFALARYNLRTPKKGE